MHRAGIALGSNLGNKIELMIAARDHVRAMNVPNEPFLQSSLYVTQPVDCPDGADMYLNAVIEITWASAEEELLLQCHRIEQSLGRIRTLSRCEPRTADVDVLYMDQVVCDTPTMVLPHPRAHLRKFVLQPLSDIRPDLILPGQSLSVAELLGQLQSEEPDPKLVTSEW